MRTQADHCPRCGRTCCADGDAACNTVWHCHDCGHVCLDGDGVPVILGATYTSNKPVWLRVFDVVAFVVITILFGWLTFLAGGTASGLDGYILGVAVTALTLHATGWRPR